MKFKCAREVKKILLVEGINDGHAIAHLCQAHKLPEDSFCIQSCGDDDKVLKELNLRLKERPELRPDIIGIVLDADKPKDNPSVISRMQQITDRLREVCKDYQIPKIPNEKGTIISSVPRYPKIGVWLMPNNQDIGMLEDFLIDLAMKKRNTEECKYGESLEQARMCVEEAEKNKLTSFKKTHFSKAIIHTYLAWHAEPGAPLGLAITAHTLEPHTELANKFIFWLKELFEIS